MKAAGDDVPPIHDRMARAWLGRFPLWFDVAQQLDPVMVQTSPSSGVQYSPGVEDSQGCRLRSVPPGLQTGVIPVIEIGEGFPFEGEEFGKNFGAGGFGAWRGRKNEGAGAAWMTAALTDRMTSRPGGLPAG